MGAFFVYKSIDKITVFALYLQPTKQVLGKHISIFYGSSKR